MTQHPDLFAALAAPFATEEVKVRAQAGRQLHYITARTVMNRLDNTLGPENWWDEYTPHENSVLCRLTIRLPDGALLTKSDAGGYAGMADSGDDDKSGYSDAFKRAAVKFGIARYLYRDGVPTFVRERAPGADDDQVVMTPTPVPSPAPAPNGHANGTNGHAKERHEWPQAQPAQAVPARPQSHGQGNGNAPRTGKALFAWVKDQEQRHEVGLLKYLNGWAKLQEFPGRMVDFDAEQVTLAFEEARRKLTAIQGIPELN